MVQIGSIVIAGTELVLQSVHLEVDSNGIIAPVQITCLQEMSNGVKSVSGMANAAAADVAAFTNVITTNNTVAITTTTSNTNSMNIANATNRKQ